ncbi:MAG: hypothetical protein ACRDV9_06655 [Acidimicrobiia bacterium]
MGDTVGTVEATYVHVFALRGRGERMKAYDQRVAAALLDSTDAAARAVQIGKRKRTRQPTG